MVPWPQNLGKVMQYASVLTLDVFTIQDIACLLQDWDSTSKQLFYTLTPTFVVLLLALPVVIARVLFAGKSIIKSKEFQILEAKFYNWVIFQQSNDFLNESLNFVGVNSLCGSSSSYTPCVP